MAHNAYLTLKGTSQGSIDGSVDLEQYRNSIEVFAVSQKITVPMDVVNGQPSGRRQHGAIVISKDLDRSSPKLMQAMLRNETITEWKLKFIGDEAKHKFTIDLVNARIASIDFRMPSTRHPDQASLSEYEEIAFAYQQIKWTWEEDGFTTQDNWKAM